jgi:hypothetical protein
LEYSLSLDDSCYSFQLLLVILFDV